MAVLLYIVSRRKNPPNSPSLPTVVTSSPALSPLDPFGRLCAMKPTVRGKSPTSAVSITDLTKLFWFDSQFFMRTKQPAKMSAGNKRDFIGRDLLDEHIEQSSSLIGIVV